MNKTEDVRQGGNEGVVYDEWMSDSDALMWHIERDPLLRSTVMSAWLLDQAPEPDRLRETLHRTLRHVPRLRQRVVEDPLGVSAPRWEPDPYFDFGYHVRRVRVAGAAGVRELLDYAQPVAMQCFDKDRPLWEMHCVEGLEGGRFGLVIKVHHAMSDGMAMVRMMEGLIELTREGHTKAERRGQEADGLSVLHLQKKGGNPSTPSSGSVGAENGRGGELFHLGEAVLHRASVALERSRRTVAAFGRGITHFAGHPLSSAGELVGTVESVARLVQPAFAPMSPLWRNRSLALNLEVLEFPLADLKRVMAAARVTLNDVFVAAVAGGLARYHAEAGLPAVELRMNMPINIRNGERGAHAGNQFVPARFGVPMTIEDPRERVRSIHDLVRHQREEPALEFIEEISAAINVLGEAASTRVTGAMMKAVDFVTSNVPGPPFPLYMSGARIERMFPFGPTAGAAVNITLFSYNGVAHVGMNCNRAAVTDSGLLRACVEAGFSEVLGIA